MRLSLPWSLIWGSALCAVTSLTSAETVPEALKRCAVEKDEKMRLACYDEVAAIAAGPSTPVKPEDTFGVKGELLRKQQEAERAAEPKIEKLEARIKNVSARPRGQLVAELDNGQVWEQKEVVSTFYLKTGEQVILEAGSLGSYWLVNESGRRTRVKRIK